MVVTNEDKMLGTRASLAAIAACLFALPPAGADAAEELNALVWCDHTDPALI